MAKYSMYLALAALLIGCSASAPPADTAVTGPAVVWRGLPGGPPGACRQGRPGGHQPGPEACADPGGLGACGRGGQPRWPLGGGGH